MICSKSGDSAINIAMFYRWFFIYGSPFRAKRAHQVSMNLEAVQSSCSTVIVLSIPEMMTELLIPYLVSLGP